MEEIKEKVKKPKTEEVHSEILLKLLDRIEGLETKKVEVENTQSLPSQERVTPARPRKIVYQIKGFTSDDAKKDGAYIPGKSYGLTKHKLVSQLLNTNIDWENRALDNWRTGLEVDEIEINDNLTEEQKTILTNDVKAARAWLEHTTGQSYGSRNSNVWKKKELEVSDTGKIYDTSKSNDHLVLYYNIIGGGYPDIAKSYDHCKREGKKLYLAVYEEEAKRRMSGEKSKYKAFAKMEDIESNWSLDDCIYLLYVLPTKRSHGFTLNTPKDLILDMFSSFINGDGTDDKKKKPQEFLDTVALFSSDPQYIKTKALFKAALYYGFVITGKDKTFVNKQTGFVYGSSEQQAMEKLIDLRNLEELGFIKGKILEKWNK